MKRLSLLLGLLLLIGLSACKEEAKPAPEEKQPQSTAQLTTEELNDYFTALIAKDLPTDLKPEIQRSLNSLIEQAAECSAEEVSSVKFSEQGKLLIRKKDVKATFSAEDIQKLEPHEATLKTCIQPLAPSATGAVEPQG